MDDEGQDVVAPFEAHQGGQDGRLDGQVEAVVTQGVEDSLERCLAAVDDGQGRGAVLGGQDDLVGYTVPVGEHGPERVVAPDQVGQGGLEGGGIEAAVEANGGRDVVGGRRAVKLVEEPEAGLGRRQRHRTVRRAGGLSPGPQRRAGAVGEVPDEPGHGRALEQGADRELEAEAGPDPADEPGGEQRMAAEGEEVVVEADGGEPEHLGEDGGQDLLGGAGRPAAGSVGRRGRGGSAARSTLLLGVSGKDSSTTTAAGTM